LRAAFFSSETAAIGWPWHAATNRFGYRPVPDAVDAIVLVAISFEVGTLIDALGIAFAAIPNFAVRASNLRLEIP